MSDSPVTSPAERRADVRRRIGLIRDALNGAFAERADVVDMLLAAFIAQEHVVLLGPPGTGKSAVVRALTACVDGAAYFERLLSKTSTEDEVCGPLAMSALRNDRYERATAGMLPQAHVAFLDETFKANSAVLNSLLALMNERVYQGAPVPVRFIAGASNEPPEDDSLAPFWDRFVFRDVTDYVQSDATWEDMIFAAAQRGAASTPFVVPARITLKEWDACRADSLRVRVSRDIVASLRRLCHALRKDGIVVSDRKWIKCTAALQAAAWLDGAAEVTPDHLSILRCIVWNKPEERERVAAHVDALDMGPAKEAQAVCDAALAAFEARSTDPSRAFAERPRLADALSRARAQAESYRGKLSRRAQSKVDVSLAAIGEAHAQLTRELASRYVA